MVSRTRSSAVSEFARFDILDSSSNLLATFSESDRSGGSGWTDINLNDWEWRWQNTGASEVKMNVSDPSRFLYDFLKRSNKVRAWFDAPAKNLICSYDMETLLSATQLYDMSGSGFPGTITGTADILGWFGRARSFNGSSKVDCGDVKSIWSAFTLAAVVSLSTTTPTDGFPMAVAKERDPGGGRKGFDIVYQTSINRLFVELFNMPTSQTSIVLQDNLIANDAYHVVITYDGTTFTAYLNGAKKGSVTTVSGNIDTTGTSFMIGERSVGSGNSWEGMVDEVALWDRAITATEVQDYYNHGSIIPKQYFEGRIYELSNKNNITTITALDSVMGLSEYEVYDLIYEGMETADTVEPAFIYKKTLPFYKSDSDHNKQHLKLVNQDGNQITSTGYVYTPMRVEYPRSAEWGSINTSFWGLQNSGDGSFPGMQISFEATDSTINKVGLLVDFTGAPTSDTYGVKIAGGPQEGSGTVFIDFFNSDGSSGFKWVYIDFTSQTAGKITPGNKYWMTLTNSQTHDIHWKKNDDSSIELQLLKKVGGVATWQGIDTNSTPCYIIQMANDYLELDDGTYTVKIGSGGTKWVVDLEGEGNPIIKLGANVPSSVGDFFRCTYFYSEGIKKVSDVINRILAKLGFSAIYVSSGALSSSLTTTNLGLYMPQGGTIKEHLEQLISQTGETYRLVPPKKLLFQNYPEPSFIKNPSFEWLDKDGAILGWSKTSACSRDTVAPFSGNYHGRINLPNGSSTVTHRFYQDIESFDPRASYLDGNNAEVWIYRNAVTTDPDIVLTIRMAVYDYGSFNNVTPLLNIDPSLGILSQTWTKFKFRINRPSFRFALEFVRTNTGAGVSAGGDIFFDDVKFHGETYYSILVKDPDYEDTDYVSGYVPNTRKSGTDNILFIDDLEATPDISEQTSDRVVNTAIQFGRNETTSFSSNQNPIVAIAQNPGSIVEYDNRTSVDNTSSFVDFNSAYKSAKTKLRIEEKYRGSLNLVGQYAYLTRFNPSLLFPTNGIRDPVPIKLTGLVLTPSTTELEFNRSIVEQFVDLSKSQAKQKTLTGAFAPIMTETLLYFDSVTLPTGLNLSTIYRAKLKLESGAYSPFKILDVLDTRDTGAYLSNSVWLLRVTLSDGAAWNTTTTDIYTAIRLETSGGSLVTEVNLPESFAKLPNMVFYAFIFAP